MGATKDVIDHHLGCFSEHDLNAVLSDYAWDAVLFTADGPLKGVEAKLRVKEIVPVVSHQETDQVHCGPGPFSMAHPDMVSTMLSSTWFITATSPGCSDVRPSHLQRGAPGYRHKRR
jgi:hypothetical protein